jgi:hypothetical protein
VFQVPTPKMRFGDAFVGIGVDILRTLQPKQLSKRENRNKRKYVDEKGLEESTDPYTLTLRRKASLKSSRSQVRLLIQKHTVSDHQ